MTHDLDTLAQGLRTRAEARQHLDQLVEVKPSELLLILDALRDAKPTTFRKKVPATPKAEG